RARVPSLPRRERLRAGRGHASDGRPACGARARARARVDPARSGGAPRLVLFERRPPEPRSRRGGRAPRADPRAPRRAGVGRRGARGAHGSNRGGLRRRRDPRSRGMDIEHDRALRVHARGGDGLRRAAIALGLALVACGPDEDGGLDARPPNPGCVAPESFPESIDETGCFEGSPPRPVAALVPYSVRVPLWSDAADKDRYVALPDGARMEADDDGRIDVPPGGVLVKTFR